MSDLVAVRNERGGKEASKGKYSPFSVFYCRGEGKENCGGIDDKCRGCD